MVRSAVLCAVFALASLVLPAASVSAADGAPKLLLLPFIVHSAEDPSYVRGGLADMLSARFERIGAIDLVREEDAEKGTSSLARARAAAREAGADYVLFGSFTRFGKGASLDVQCAPTGGGGDREPLREIFVHSGSIGEIIPDLDELAGKVSRFARGEMVDRRAPAAGETASVPARELSELARRVADLEAAIEALKAAGAGTPTAALGGAPGTP